MQDLYHQPYCSRLISAEIACLALVLWAPRDRGSGLQALCIQAFNVYRSIYIRIFFRPAEHSKSFTWMNVRKLFGVEMQAETSQSPLQREC